MSIIEEDLKCFNENIEYKVAETVSNYTYDDYLADERAQEELKIGLSMTSKDVYECLYGKSIFRAKWCLPVKIFRRNVKIVKKKD